MALTLFSERLPPARARIEVALLNNMPDSALEATELQFGNLLAAAAGPMEVRLRCFSLPEIARGETARRRIADHYCDLRDLWDCDLDALIVAGTEPKSPDLRQEPYWNNLSAVMDWAKTEVVSSVWSCLAAHAAVLYFDAVARQPLAQKCCGVFEHGVTPHPLTRGLAAPQRTPHSRWNTILRPALEASGYHILTDSPLAGVNLFIKQLGSQFIFWQGHPEYDDRSLLKEYQRDVQRFLRKERETYPNMPYGYFSPPAEERLAAFEARALAAPYAGLIGEFPYEFASAGLQNTWRASAVQFYQNWLAAIVDAKGTRGVRRAPRRAEPRPSSAR